MYIFKQFTLKRLIIYSFQEIYRYKYKSIKQLQEFIIFRKDNTKISDMRFVCSPAPIREIFVAKMKKEYLRNVS